MVDEAAGDFCEAPGQVHVAVGKGRVNEAKVGECGAENGVKGSGFDFAVDQVSGDSAPKHRGKNKAVSERDDEQ